VPQTEMFLERLPCVCATGASRSYASHFVKDAMQGSFLRSPQASIATFAALRNYYRATAL
jgi:hypothetical protein